MAIVIIGRKIVWYIIVIPIKPRLYPITPIIAIPRTVPMISLSKKFNLLFQ